MTEPNTTTPEKALRLRSRIKKNKPKFVRPESWRYVRLKETWRNPRGLDHKVRLSYKGWPPAAGSGYGGPKVARGLHPSGYEEVLVYNVEQLSIVTPKTQAIRIAHTVGRRKRGGILAEARRKRMVVLNLREPTEAREEKPAEKKEEEKAEEAEVEEPKELAETEKPKPEEKTRKRRRRAKEQ
jgi:large subunit ribosomal protein L32e